MNSLQKSKDHLFNFGFVCPIESVLSCEKELPAARITTINARYFLIKSKFFGKSIQISAY